MTETKKTTGKTTSKKTTDPKVTKVSDVQKTDEKKKTKISGVAKGKKVLKKAPSPLPSTDAKPVKPRTRKKILAVSPVVPVETEPLVGLIESLEPLLSPTVSPVGETKPEAEIGGARETTPSAPPETKSVPVVKPPLPTVPSVPRKELVVSEGVSVKELSETMGVKMTDVLRKLLTLGVMANMNQGLDDDTVELLADAFGFDVKIKSAIADEVLAPQEDVSSLVPRPPVVTVMGHVDLGKTSLLDAIRSARVAEKEAGGITQHIGAYQVKTERGLVTFLDTPGHEAFTAMRSRGAQATDIVVLVVAADDGVMPQTVEALDHARAAGVPIVVAINKCDLPTANVQKIKQELANLNLMSEDWGGKTIMVEVSARTKTNVDKLLEMISLEAELLELKANPHRPAQGVVVEAKLDPRRGSVATVLIQKGTLKVGDAFVCGVTAGKIRALVNDRGERVKDAPPAFPVEILGMSGTPQAGETLVVVSSDREARDIAERRQIVADAESRKVRHHVTLEAVHEEAKTGKVKFLPIVLKTDVQGSLGAIRDSLIKLANAEISVKVIHAGVGGINNSDVVLADASDAVILGFNVRPDPVSEALAKHTGVEIKTYRVIYDMINEVKAGLEGLLDPEEKEVTQGWAEIRKVISAPKAGLIAGCMVTNGKVTRVCKARLLRNDAIVFEGSLGSLKRFKDDVREVEKGYECGITLANFQDLKPGDRLEFYTVEKQARTLGA